MKQSIFIILITFYFFSFSSISQGEIKVRRAIKKQVDIAIFLSKLDIKSTKAIHFKNWNKVIKEFDENSSNIGENDLETLIELNVTYLIKVFGKNNIDIIILFYFDNKGKLIDCFTNKKSKEYYDEIMTFMPKCMFENE